MASPTSALPSVTGGAILQIALQHVGEKYVLGIQVPKDNPNWKGPWDCAEFVSWSVFQAARMLYGCDKDTAAPASADAYTGYWERDSLNFGRIISLDEAARTAGAAVLRFPQVGASGHIVLSDFSTTGDGLIAALQVLAEVVHTGKPVSEVCHVFDAVPQVLRNVKTGEGKPLENNYVKQAIAEAMSRLGEGGRLVIRPSGTEPLIRVMAEGDDETLVHRLVDDLCRAIERAVV